MCFISLHFRTIWARGRPARDFERQHGKAEVDENQKLTVKHLYLLCIVFAFGIIFSTLTFLLEKGKNIRKRTVIIGTQDLNVDILI